MPGAQGSLGMGDEAAGGAAGNAGGPVPSRPPDRRVRTLVAAAVVIAVAVLVVGIPLTLLPGASPAGSPAPASPVPAPSTAAASPLPPAAASPSAVAAGSPIPSASPAAWAALDVPPLPVVAELTPDAVDGAGPDPATTFTLRSLDGTAAATLAAGLTVEPAVDLAVAPGPDASSAVVRLGAPLERGTTYRFTLSRPDGTLAGGWAFRPDAPPRVVGTIPGDGTSSVPVDAGIEIAFDSDGVADPTDWFAIAPATAGRFQRHDRTWVFVPETLEPSTLYTVTLRPGVPVDGSSLVLERGATFRFETDGPVTEQPFTIGPQRAVVEVAPGEAPIVGIGVASDGDVDLPASLVLTLHRIPDVETAAAAASALADRPGWTEHPHDAVDTTALPKAGRVKARLALDQGNDYAGSLHLPRALDPGWYVADFPDDVAAGQQVLLQVTPVAPYVAAARDRTVAWVNGVGSGPVAGASVRVAGGSSLGSTGADGLLVAQTPAGLFPEDEGPDGDWWSAPHPVFVVEAPGLGAAVVPLGIGSNTGLEGVFWNLYPDPSRTRWTSSLATDRSDFRRTDSIAAWGVVRDLASGATPDLVEIELAPAGERTGPWSGGTPSAAVAHVDAVPSSRGVYTATIPVDALPLGGYTLTLSAGGTVLESRWISVDVIRKPTYRLDVSADRHAVLAGDPVTLTASATFYDGTPVPGLPLRIHVADVTRGSADDDEGTSVTTGADGLATLRIVAQRTGSVSVSSASPELGEAEPPSVDLQVFPASTYVDVDAAELAGGAVRVTGTVRTVDLASVEASIAADEPWSDHVGPAAPGVRVAVRVEPTIQVATRTGTAYDYVLKRTSPVYSYEDRSLPAVTGNARTDAAGAFTVSVTLPREARVDGSSVEVTASATDSQGRTDEADAYADRPRPAPVSSVVWLDPGSRDGSAARSWPCGGNSRDYAVGDTVRLSFRDGDGPLPTGALRRFLFVTASGGIRDAAVTAAPALALPFDREAMPGFDVLGVAFDGSSYRATPWTTRARVDVESRLVTVTVSTDLAAGAVHRPGDAASVTIRTTDPAGAPVAADLVVRAVDEKLYDAGIAEDEDPAWALFSGRSAGIVGTYVSHQLPANGDSPGCGSTTGGGGGAGGLGLRSDFRDRILFVRTTTGPDGLATVPLDIPDDLTSWHVAVDAITDDLRAGSATASVPVGLPFFVEPVLPDTVLAADRPSILLRAYGSGLKAGDPVRFTVRAPTLRSDPVTVDGVAFEPVAVPLLPAGAADMPVGRHGVVVEGSTRSAAGSLADAKELTLEVVTSRVGARRTTVVELGPGAALPGASDGLTTCVLADAGRASLVPLLEELAAEVGPRADQGGAAAAASDLLVSAFARDPATLSALSFDPEPYMPGGVAIVPYGDADLEVTALAALGAPDRFGRTSLEQYLSGVATDATETRDRRIVALAGLAALGIPVLADLRAAAAAEGLTAADRAWLSVGLAEAGDLAGAAALERALLLEHGERAGGWARVRIGASAHDSIAATALLAIAAARVGDPLAPDLAAYVSGERDPEAVHPLEELAYASRSLERLPRAAAQVAYTVGGERRVADLGPGRTVSLTLTPAQRAGAVAEPVAGAASAACSWDAPGAAALPSDGSVRVVRTVTPSGPVPAGSLVTIELRVTFDALAPSGLYRAVEILPAGIAPTGSLVGPAVETPGEEEAGPAEDRYEEPWSIVGNRAEWGIWRADASDDSFVLRTVGRVVAPGTYAWEPAIVQSVTAPTVGATVPASDLTVLAP